MRELATWTTAVMFSLLVPFMSSCLDDDDSIEAMMSNNAASYYAALGTVVMPSFIAGEAMVESDDGDVVYVVNPDMLTLNDANKEGQRIFYNYVESGAPSGKENTHDTFIQMTDLMKILTKSIDFLSDEEEDVYGSDGIDILFYSLCKNYLTLQFQILASGGDISHRISLVSKGESPDNDGFLPLELRHNAEGDKQLEALPGYVSFLLTDAPGFKEGTLTGFKITYRSVSNGQQTKTFTLSKDSKAVPSPFTWKEPCNTKIK